MDERKEFPVKHKKFVKQIMSTGRDRNTAEFMAKCCQAWREPYAKAWERYKGIMLKHERLWAVYFLTTRPDFPQGGAQA